MFNTNAVLKQKLLETYILPDTAVIAVASNKKLLEFESPIDCQAIALFFNKNCKYVDIFYTTKINNNDYKLDTKYSFSVQSTNHTFKAGIISDVTEVEVAAVLLLPERNSYDKLITKDSIANIGANEDILAYKIIY